MPINFGTKRQPPVIFPKGCYRVRVENAEEKVGKESGVPYMNLTLAVLGRSGQPEGNRIWDIISTNPKARFKVDQFLDALNVPDEEDELPMKWFIGRTMFALLRQAEFNGQLKNEVEKYLTEEQAEKYLQQQALEDGDHWAAPESFDTLEPAAFEESVSAEAEMPDEMMEEETEDVVF